MVPRLALAVARRLRNAIATQIHKATVNRVGTGTKIFHSVFFIEPKKVEIGKNCLIWHGIAVDAEGPAGLLRIGDGAQINPNVTLDLTGHLEIGDNALISENSFLYTHDHGLDPRSEPTAYNKTIGKNSWIGMRSIILPRCQKIGESAVVGAGSVVVKDVPDGAIVAGSPARIVGWKDGFGPKAAASS
ncbi:acyltransferase [Erythrobacter crassostreae]|uniref:Acyltransferase n=1 Tax=Erythrobacter crassostreae TaxID=2828328 RepID=A0A9X1JM92_9SPHN|nr:DapH/DapD/GlmU-related protein [Erythrobacter crassostrea]MBV7258518.1 acyltransferase [Erythrobacter crassostrea]